MTNRDHSPSVAQNEGGDAKLRTEGSGLDLDALEAVARAATPGPWFCAEAVRPGKIDGYNGSFTEFVGYEILGRDDAVVHAATAGFQAETDAEFAATFDPLTCLAMIQTQRELVAALKHEVANCPLCKGEGRAVDIMELIRALPLSGEEITGEKVECPRCKDHRALIARIAKAEGRS